MVMEISTVCLFNSFGLVKRLSVNFLRFFRIMFSSLFKLVIYSQLVLGTDMGNQFVTSEIRKSKNNQKIFRPKFNLLEIWKNEYKSFSYKFRNCKEVILVTTARLVTVRT